MQFSRILWNKIIKLVEKSDPDGIQTHDLQNRNLTFYSAELRGR